MKLSIAMDTSDSAGINGMQMQHIQDELYLTALLQLTCKHCKLLTLRHATDTSPHLWTAVALSCLVCEQGGS